jgi:hypothetical protein
MALTHLASERIRVTLYWLVILAERYKDTPRHIIASMIVPHVVAALGIRETAAFGYIRQAHNLGYIEDDTSIGSGPNRRSKPIQITDLGVRVLGQWHESALTNGRNLRKQDDAAPPPLPLEQAG